jgi:hypothetical protein
MAETQVVGRVRLRQIALGVLIGAVLAVLILLVGILFLVHRFFPGGPTEHHNPSFRYGERVLNSIYSKPGQDPIDEACRRAITGRTDYPQPFDFPEAVAGCTYQEWIYDN